MLEQNYCSILLNMPYACGLGTDIRLIYLVHMELFVLHIILLFYFGEQT